MPSCSCLPAPASLRPRKIYKLLVPDVFDGHNPNSLGPIDLSTKRKIGKMVEYISFNPQNAGKASST
jgi:hypothetical protein